MSNHRRLLDAVLLAFHPARWSVFGLRFVPLMLLAAGGWAVIYGGFYRHITVSDNHPETQHEEPFTITTQPMPPPGFPGGPPEGLPSGPPGMVPFPPEAFSPPLKTIQAVKTTIIPAWTSTSEESELTVNRAVEVAGMVLGPQGEILRVSSEAAVNGAEGPAFCPS
jgi:hypothetical protein